MQEFCKVSCPFMHKVLGSQVTDDLKPGLGDGGCFLLHLAILLAS